MSNLAVYVAVGRKTVKIAKKVYLQIKIWKFQINYSFLIVAGLSTDVILGADFLKTYGGIINFELMGEIIPKNNVIFRSVVNDENKNEAGSYNLKICMQQCVENRHVRAVGSGIGGEESKHNNCEENIEGVIDSDGLDNVSRDTLLETLENYDEHLQNLKVYEHEIRVTVQKPFVRKSYPVPLRQQPAVDREIDRMLQQRIITRSCSEFCNPIRIVQKKKETCAFVSTRDG